MSTAERAHRPFGLVAGEAFSFSQSATVPPGGSCFPEVGGEGSGGPVSHRPTVMQREQAATHTAFNSGGSGIIANKQPCVAVLLQTKY